MKQIKRLLCKIFRHSGLDIKYATYHVLYDGPLGGKSIRMADMKIFYCKRCSEIINEEEV